MPCCVLARRFSIWIPRTDAEFAEGDDGLVSEIVIKAGGMLSLFGPRAGKGVSIATPNASGAIRGTTTYIAWQEKEARTYICCCYGSVEIANSAGGGQRLDTRYHNAIILPTEGGTAPAPYDRPLDHFDDDIAYLESQVGRRTEMAAADRRDAVSGARSRHRGLTARHRLIPAFNRRILSEPLSRFGGFLRSTVSVDFA